MSVITDAALKLFFETGDTPTEAQFIDFIDSKLNIGDLQATPTNSLLLATASKYIFDKITKGFLPKVSSGKVANYTVLDADGIETVRMTTGGTNRTVILPTASANTDREITILKVDSGSGTVIVDGEGAETLGYLGITQATIIVELEGSGIVVKCNGTNWDVIKVIGAEIASISGVLEVIYTKYFLGTTDADSQTDVAHGIAAHDKIISANAMVKDGSNYRVHDYLEANAAADAYNFIITSTNLQLSAVGSNLQSQPYRIEVKFHI